MERYDSFKDSGVEWLGEIPSHWEKGKLYQYSEMSNGSTPSRVKPEYWENGTIPWMSSGEINKKRIREIEGKITLEGFENSSTKLLPVGTVMMGLNGQGKTKGTVGILEIETTCNQSLCGMIFNDDINPVYGYYFLDSQYYHIRGLVGEGQREGISVSFLSRYPLVVPPLSEQQQIVSFLDSKSSLIDSLIEKTQRKIELLKEKRTSLINEVVTKGLNPIVEMKDSGVEWIGEIPSHYRVGKLKHLCDENQRSLSNSTDPNYELNYIEISDVNSEGVIGKSTPYIFSESPSRCRRIVQRGDVIVSTVRTYLKSIGLIEEEVEDLICSTGFSVLTPLENINPKYLFYLLRTEWFISMVISNSEGVSYPSIQSEKLMNIDVVFCEFSEQQQIVEYLDEQTQLIDNTISIEEKRIELLKEYRQSLISEVVTGKRKVVK